MVCGSGAVAILCSRRVAERHGGFDGAAALCSEFDGHGPDGHESLFRLVARADGLQHGEQRVCSDTELGGAWCGAGGVAQQQDAGHQRPGSPGVLPLQRGGIGCRNVCRSRQFGRMDSGFEDALYHRQRLAGPQSQRHAVCVQRKYRLDDIRFNAHRAVRQTLRSRFPVSARI